MSTPPTSTQPTDAAAPRRATRRNCGGNPKQTQTHCNGGDLLAPLAIKNARGNSTSGGGLPRFARHRLTLPRSRERRRTASLRSAEIDRTGRPHNYHVVSSARAPGSPAVRCRYAPSLAGSAGSLLPELLGFAVPRRRGLLLASLDLLRPRRPSSCGLALRPCALFPPGPPPIEGVRRPRGGAPQGATCPVGFLFGPALARPAVRSVGPPVGAFVPCGPAFAFVPPVSQGPAAGPPRR